jgi:hypothetical protein
MNPGCTSHQCSLLTVAPEVLAVVRSAEICWRSVVPGATVGGADDAELHKSGRISPKLAYYKLSTVHASRDLKSVRS